MRIGFPVVVKIGNKKQDVKEVLKVFVTTQKSAQPNILIKGVTEVQQELLQQSLPNTGYRPLVKTLLECGRSVIFSVEGGSASARMLMLDQPLADLPTLNIDGQSGTLALFLLTKLFLQVETDQNGPDVLLAGKATYDTNRNAWRAGVLNEIADTKVKVKNAISEQLWLHKTDYDLLEKADLTDQIVPFDSPNGDLGWILQEFCQRNNLVLTDHDENERALKDKRADTPKFFRTERDLFEAAIDSELFGANSESETAFDDALNLHFGTREPRRLLGIQRLSLRPKNRMALFVRPGQDHSSTLRHVLISGPTGSGKTTLLHSLVLNGLHSRGGGVLYVGPVKALVEEFYASVSTGLTHLLPKEIEQRIVISTGDYSKEDVFISHGRFGLACMVNEKANVLFSVDEPHKLMQQLSLVIIDELHMLRDPSRGGVLDMLITKVALESRKRQIEGDHKQLQLVMVSTENMAERVAKMPIFSTSQYRVNDIKGFAPINLVTRKRPVPVQHRVAILSEVRTRGQPDFELRDVVMFENDDDRQMSDSKLAKLVRSLGPRGVDWNPRINTTGGNYRLDGQIQELILARRHANKTMIVALPSVETTYSTARALTKRLTHSLDNITIPTAFREAVERSGLGSLQGDVIRWAGKGIFVHHGQLPRKLRSATEAIFRQPVLANSRTKILLTTETLTFGVNLSATCVVLANLEWSRDDPMDPFLPPKPEFIDSNRYHNILGRAGRLGLIRSNESAEAIVCIPVSRFITPGKRQDFLDLLYKAQTHPTPFTSIAQNADVARFAFDRSDGKGKYKETSYFDLKAYSFSAFRSVIDSLRTTRRGRTMADALSVFSSTLFFQSELVVTNQNAMGKFDALFTAILDKTVEYAKADIKLVTKVGDTFTITAAASALIDTGTSLVSVEPISIWIQALRRRADLELLTSEALLPGLIAAPDFTKVACELVPNALSKDVFDNQTQANERLASARKMGLIELELINASGLINTLDDFLEREEIINALQLIPVVERRPVVYWQLLSAVLRWLRGCTPMEVVEALIAFAPSVTDPKNWLPKHADRLEQLSKMCYRFFSIGDGFLTDQLKLQLPQLALRLKHGVPFSATPYLNVFSSDGVLPREAVVALYQSIPDPFILLAGHGRDIASAQRVVSSISSSVNDAAEVVVVVRRAYSDYCSTFLNSIERDTAQSLVSNARIIFDLGEGAFAPNWRVGQLIAQLAQCVQDDAELGHDLLLTVVEIEGTPSYQIRSNGQAACVAFGIRSCNQQHIDDLLTNIEVLSWHDRTSRDQWTITPCALVLILNLLLRRFVTVPFVVENLHRKKACRIDVYWIASNFWLSPGLAGMSALREDLLGFIEPVSRLQTP